MRADYHLCVRCCVNIVAAYLYQVPAVFLSVLLYFVNAGCRVLASVECLFLQRCNIENCRVRVMTWRAMAMVWSRL